MRKSAALALCLLVQMTAWGQLQLSFIQANNQSMASIPRYGLDFPFIKNLHKANLHAGLNIRNQGIIFDQESSTLAGSMDRIKFRAYSLSPEFKYKAKLGKLGVEIGGGLDWYFHYKQKRFEGGERSQKSIEFAQWIPNPGVSNSNRVNQFNPYARVAIGKRKGMGIYAEYYFLKDFLNSDFSYINDVGLTVKPYEGWKTQRLNLGIWVSL